MLLIWIDRFGRYWPLLAAVAAAFMLAVAHGFETFGGYPPCELCLKQREVYWLILWAGALLFLAVLSRPYLLRPVCWLLAALFLAECALAAYHAGVEWKWWPGPMSCTGAGVHALTAADMSGLLSGKPQHIIQCDVAAWRFLGLSMAGWNALAALKWTIFSAFFAIRKPVTAGDIDA
jgi:disulfide bond formation protein DsbB